jgi:hypothetical protein
LAAIWRQITTSSSTTSTRTPVGVDSLAAAASTVIELVIYERASVMAVPGPGSHIQASQFADPCRVADVTLAAAVRASADAVYIEPMAMLGLIGFTPALESP